MSKPRILAIIPARGGSKGLVGKNIKVLGDKPLIAWTIQAALSTEEIYKTIVSTDCTEIASVAKEYGAEVPFIRPDTIATDGATTADVISHAINFFDEKFDIIIVLQPTSPFRTNTDIRNAITLYNDNTASSVVSVVKSDKSPYWSFFVDDSLNMRPILNLEGQFSRRQELPDSYFLNGAIYIVGTKQFLRDAKFIYTDSLSYVMCKKSSIDIDDIMDFKLAQLMLGVK